MQIKSLQEQLKAHWERMNSPDAMVLGKGERASSGLPKVTIRPTGDGPFVVLEEPVDLPVPENAVIHDYPK